MASIVNVPRFNTRLDDAARKHYEPVVATLFALSPLLTEGKIVEVNVQQGFVLAAVISLCRDFPRARILSIGCLEDTTYHALLRMGLTVERIDPAPNGIDFDTCAADWSELKSQYDVVFSTSVLEHVEDDERFVGQIADLLRPGGFGVFTCDFKEHWAPGDAIPTVDFRYYNSRDLKERLLGAMPNCHLVDKPDWERFEPDFEVGNCHYSFASFVVEKSATA